MVFQMPACHYPWQRFANNAPLKQNNSLVLKPINWNGLKIASVFSINVLQDELFHEPLVDMFDTSSQTA